MTSSSKLNKKLEETTNSMNNQIYNLTSTANREIESLNMKLSEANEEIARFKEQGENVQENLRRAFFKNIMNLNSDAATILGIDEQDKQSN